MDPVQERSFFKKRLLPKAAKQRHGGRRSRPAQSAAAAPKPTEEQKPVEAAQESEDKSEESKAAVEGTSAPSAEAPLTPRDILDDFRISGLFSFNNPAFDALAEWMQQNCPAGAPLP